MTDPRQAMQMALEALDTSLFWLKSLNLGKTFDGIKERADALRAALSAQQKPVENCADNDSPWLVCKPCAAAGKCAMRTTHPAPTAQQE